MTSYEEVLLIVFLSIWFIGVGGFLFAIVSILLFDKATISLYLRWKARREARKKRRARERLFGCACGYPDWPWECPGVTNCSRPAATEALAAYDAADKGEKP